MIRKTLGRFGSLGRFALLGLVASLSLSSCFVGKVHHREFRLAEDQPPLRLGSWFLSTRLWVTSAYEDPRGRNLGHDFLMRIETSLPRPNHGDSVLDITIDSIVMTMPEIGETQCRSMASCYFDSFDVKKVLRKSFGFERAESDRGWGVNIPPEVDTLYIDYYATECLGRHTRVPKYSESMELDDTIFVKSDTPCQTYTTKLLFLREESAKWSIYELPLGV